ncbi:MAG: benzoyl-CoA reductase subunit D [Deltaproteobacteria bacterium]|nr:benzoyl-CoA reductase subunit D [Deltaproteobacteria bacterium]
MAKRHLTAGIDVGSSSVKCAIVGSDGGALGEVLGTSVQRIRRRIVSEVARAAFEEACAAAKVDCPKPGAESTAPFDYVATTGEAELMDGATGHFYGMTAHARGALYLEPQAICALDVGALHARAIRMDARGKVLRHRMTSQCASGSGQFIENIARYLGVPLEDVGQMSAQSKSGEEVSSICAVLAETDVINMVSRGITPADILKGIHLSLAGRLIRLLRAIGSDGIVVVTGGLAVDEGLIAALRELIAKEKQKAGVKVTTMHADPRGIAAGAIGAALLGAYRVEQLARAGSAVAAAV